MPHLPTDADSTPNYTAAQHATHHDVLADTHNVVKGPGRISARLATMPGVLGGLARPPILTLDSTGALTSSLGTGLSAPAPGAGIVPLVVQGAAGQSADLQQWQDGAGAVLARIGSNGLFRTDAFVDIGGASLGGYLDVRMSQGGVPGIRISGFSTNDLQQWMDAAGSTVLSRILSTGAFSASGAMGGAGNAAVVAANTSAGSNSVVADWRGIAQDGTTETSRISVGGHFMGTSFCDLGATVVLDAIASSRFASNASLWLTGAGHHIQFKSPDGTKTWQVTLANDSTFNMAIGAVAPSWTTDDLMFAVKSPGGTARAQIFAFGDMLIDVNQQNTATNAAWGAAVPLTVRHDGGGTLAGDLFAVKLGSGMVFNVDKALGMFLNGYKLQLMGSSNPNYWFQGSSSAPTIYHGYYGLQIENGAAAQTCLILKGFGGQSADIQQWNIGGAPLSRIRADGSFAGVARTPVTRSYARANYR